MLATIKNKLDAIPAHIRYPGGIMALLVGSMCAQFTLLHAATSDGGAQVEPDYYAKAVGWDERARAQDASARLGWSARLALRGERGELSVSGRGGEHVEGVKGRVVLTRPHVAEERLELELEPRGGALTFALPEGAPGLWDVRVELTDARGARFTDTLRSEW